MKVHEYRENETLDLHNCEITGATDEVKSYRNKVLKSIKKNLEHDNVFAHLTKIMVEAKSKLTQL